MPLNPWSYEYVPASAVPLFRMAWQLETWLRTIVYVELRAARVDWEEAIKAKADKWPPPSKASDKKLHHMATPHQAALSYLTFGQLWNVISEAANWPHFEPYFPPKENTFVRIDEIKAIRNRVAHFREPHPQDEARFELFMRDMEPGVRTFCERYTEDKLATEPEHDPVSAELEKSWDSIGYGIELSRPYGGILYAPGHLRQDPRMKAELHLLTHKNYKRGSLEGVIYKLTFGHTRNGQFNSQKFVENTEDLHKDIIHILLSDHDLPPAVTIPAIHGIEATADLIASFLKVALNNNSDHSLPGMDRDRLKWEEHILWPDHMLTFFTKEMREPVLDLTKPA